MSHGICVSVCVCVYWWLVSVIYVHVSSKFLCHLHLATVSSYLMRYKNIRHGCCCVTICFFFSLLLLSTLVSHCVVYFHHFQFAFRFLFFNALVSHHVVSRWISHSLFYTFGRLLNKNTMTECARECECVRLFMWMEWRNLLTSSYFISRSPLPRFLHSCLCV